MRACGPGRTRVTRLGESLQVFRGNMLMVEGHHVHRLGEGLEGREVRIVSDAHLIDDLSGRGVGGLSEN